MEQLPASQASSHYPLEPISASVVVERETARRNALRQLGPCRSGCVELDEYVLVGGGFERGCVVGVSAEDEDGFGVTLGLQVIANSLCSGSINKALVITPKPAAVLLRSLQNSIKAELLVREEPGQDMDMSAKVIACLDSVMLSCVFDLDGLWEVLEDLDRPRSATASPVASRRTAPPSSQPEEREDDPGPENDETKASQVSEIQDSEDDESPLATPAEPPHQDQPDEQPRQSSQEEKEDTHKEETSSSPNQHPEIILITHFSALLTSLFTQREKSAAHSALQLLGSHLRHLSRSLPSNPLIIILNSTTSSFSSSTEQFPSEADQHLAKRTGPSTGGNKPLDPTLRSIFNPPPLPIPGYVPSNASHRNKPSFGLVFSQLLDLHLLCSRMPRRRDDAEAVLGVSAGASAQDPYGAGQPRFVTAVEVLLDEMGVWQGKRGPRPSREQRWAPLRIENGRVVDGIPKVEVQNMDDIRIATSGGFGGRRP